MTTEITAEVIDQEVAEVSHSLLFSVEIYVGTDGRKSVVVENSSGAFVTQRLYHGRVSLDDALARVLTDLGYSDPEAYKTETDGEITEDNHLLVISVYDLS